MDISDDVNVIAQQVLAEKPSLPVRVRLLRDGRHVSSSDPRLKAAIDWLDDNPHVHLLASEQLPDGSWGRIRLKRTIVSGREYQWFWPVCWRSQIVVARH